MYKAVIFAFKVSQNFIVYESAEDRNLRAIFNRVKMHYLAIFLPNSIATRMPYLPAKDELVSLDRLSSRGLWKWYNSKGFGPATIWRGAAFHFLAVFSKMKILWKLWLWFSKMFHQRGLSDWKWSISKFQFWRRILDIYKQPLLMIRFKPIFDLSRMAWHTLESNTLIFGIPFSITPSLLSVSVGFQQQS